MSITLQLLDTDATYLRDITGAIEGSRDWSTQRTRWGRGGLAIPNDHDDAQHLAPRRFVRCLLDGQEAFTWMLVKPQRQRISTEGHGGQVTTWDGDGAGIYLGSGRWGGAVATGVTPNGFRVFGWIEDVWDTSTWTSPAPYSGGHHSQPARTSWKIDRWPDKYAEWITTADYTGPLYVEQKLDKHGPVEGVTLWFAGKGKAYIGGDKVATVDVAGGATTATVDLAGGVEKLKIYGEAGRVAWTIGTMVDGKWRTLYRSTTGAPYSVDRNEVQTVVLAPEPPPYPWGGDYPSTGGANLQGTWQLRVPGIGTTAPMQWDASNSTIAGALEALSGITSVTVTGSGTAGSPWEVTFLDGGPMPQMELIHRDLRHDHDVSAVNTTVQGRTTLAAKGGADKIAVTFTEPTGVTLGYVMVSLFGDVQPDYIPAIDTDATAAKDSGGADWTTTKATYRVRDPELYGDILLAACEAFRGDFEVVTKAGGGMRLRLWDDMGADLTGTGGVTLWDEADGRPVANTVVDEAVVETTPPAGTVIRTQSQTGFGWYEDEADGIPTWGRIAIPVTIGTADEVDEAVALADAAQDNLAARTTQEILTSGPIGARPHIDCHLGDLVNLRRDDGGPMLGFEVDAITVVDRPANDPDFVVDLVLP